jgi:hypothetical protein
MKSTIKLQLAATAKLKNAFVELCKCEKFGYQTATINYSMKMIHSAGSNYIIISPNKTTVSDVVIT